MINLRLWTYDTAGKEMSTLFSFTPLTDRDSYDYDRESTRGVGRELNRRPYARQEVRELVLPAGFLLDPKNLRNVQRLFDAHKIEWQRTVNSKLTWVEYTLDAGEQLTFDRLDDVDALRRVTISLVQKEPVWFTDFENTKVAVI
jgi:hypothetical protein